MYTYDCIYICIYIHNLVYIYIYWYNFYIHQRSTLMVVRHKCVSHADRNTNPQVREGYGSLARATYDTYIEHIYVS